MELQGRKCNEKAREYLEEAVDLQSNSKYFKAIEACNKGLCFVKAKSSCAAQIFAKRSEIYFAVGRYQTCIDNIKLARQNHERLPELDELDCKCQEMISKHHEEEEEKCVWDFFKLSHQPNQKIPFISSYLKPIQLGEFGRCVITTRNLYPGEVVAIEEPFLRVLNKDSRHQRCACCLKSNFMSLIPCEKCTTSNWSILLSYS